MKTSTILVGLLILLSCQNHRQELKRAYDRYPYDYCDAVSEYLSYPLPSASDSIKEVRVWSNPEMSDVKYLRVFRKTNSESIVQDYTYYPSKKDNKIFVDSFFVTSGKFRLGVDSLIVILKALGFDTLRSQPDSIKQMIGDGKTYLLEVKTIGEYKAIDYNSPAYFKDESHEVFSKMIKFLLENN